MLRKIALTLAFLLVVAWILVVMWYPMAMMFIDPHGAIPMWYAVLAVALALVVVGGIGWSIYRGIYLGLRWIWTGVEVWH